MSLIILYKDALVADQRSVLRYPYALGQIYNTKKIQMAKDKTFAFGSIGPTLTDTEKDILEAIIRQSFQNAKGEHPIIELDHQDWFTLRKGLNIFVMTKISSYHSFIAGSDRAEAGAYGSNTKLLKRSSLVRFEPDFPAGGGTGFQPASMALMEGIPIEKLMPIVADVVFTVSPEFDIIRRRSLKRMFR